MSNNLLEPTLNSLNFVNNLTVDQMRTQLKNALLKIANIISSYKLQKIENENLKNTVLEKDIIIHKLENQTDNLNIENDREKMMLQMEFEEKINKAKIVLNDIINETKDETKD
jgi:hypothetical protein